MTSVSLEVLRRAADSITPQSQNERILASLIREQDRIIRELSEKLSHAEQQLSSKAHALSILQKARKNQEEHLSRQVSVIESLEAELKRASSERVETPSRSPRPTSLDQHEERRSHRRRVRNDLYTEHFPRSDKPTIHDYRLSHRRRIAPVV